MFDVGFSEMMVIAVVALIVIGPERLPKVARTLGHLLGRMQRYVNDVKADINREMEVEELRKFKEQFQDAAQSVEQTIHGGLAQAQSDMSGSETTAGSLAETPALSGPEPVAAPSVDKADQARDGSAGTSAPS